MSGKRTTDIILPNQSGDVDPRILQHQFYADEAKRKAAKPKEPSMAMKIWAVRQFLTQK